jgi:hypothetical protein
MELFLWSKLKFYLGLSLVNQSVKEVVLFYFI